MNGTNERSPHVDPARGRAGSNLCIAGMGWVTPLGSGVDEVWKRLLNGDTASAEQLSSPLGRDYPVFRVPVSALAKAPAHPRLRRSSAISRFAAVAGLEALANANVKLDPQTAKRTALVFAVSNGGVIYTKRFYHDIVESGAQAASPLLFPETVFNAPASHLAAILGITGASYTLVGGDAYHKWRLLRSAPPIEPFQQPPHGTILSEGASAILIGRSGPIQIDQIASGTNFSKQREACAGVDKVFAKLCATPADVVSASANGTFIDDAERSAILKHSAQAQVYSVKQALGEGVGASSLWQTIAAGQTLITQKLPGSTERKPLRTALVSTCGLNQQVAGLRISR